MASVVSITTVVFAFPALSDTTLSNDVYRLTFDPSGAALVATGDTLPQRFEPRFSVLISDHDPKLELRWGEWGLNSGRF